MKEDNYSDDEIKEFLLEGFRRFQWSKFEQVKGINYKGDYCSALHALPPEDPDNYVRVYYFTAIKHASDNINNKRLKMSSFDAVNDLFEIYSFLEINDRVRTTELDDLRSEAKKSASEKCFLSTTLDWNSPAMWAHYADTHKGVCLGIDIKKDLLKPVNYVSNRGLVSEGVLENCTDDLFRTKHSSWSYENEYRVILPQNDSRITKGELNYFNSGCDSFTFRELIFGCALSDGDINKVISEIVNKDNLTIIKARKYDHEYKMVPYSNADKKYEPYFFFSEKSIGVFKSHFKKTFG